MFKFKNHKGVEGRLGGFQQTRTNDVSHLKLRVNIVIVCYSCFSKNSSYINGILLCFYTCYVMLSGCFVTDQLFD